MRILALLTTCLLAGCMTTPSGVDALQGNWAVTSAEHEGKPMDAVVGGTLTVAGERFHIRTASGAELNGQLRVDSSKRPAQLDFIHETGMPNMHWLAIYEVQGNALRLNYVDVTLKEPRPAQFITSGTTEASLLTLRRTEPARQ